MREGGADHAPEKYSQETVGSRRLLLGASVIGFLVRAVPLSGEPVPVFGIGLSVSDEVLQGMLALVLVYLAASFMVRV